MTARLALLAASLLLAAPAFAQDGEGLADADLDQDGWTESEGDCRDDRADTWPGAEETCWDGVDQDCSGRPDDACTFVDYELIRMLPAPSARTATVEVDYPAQASEAVGFLAVQRITEHGDDQCDYTTRITDLGNRMRFVVDLEHCGRGHSNFTYAFVAKAVVIARVGDGGQLMAYDLDSQANLPNNHRISASPAWNGPHNANAFCAMHTADGQGSNENEWFCTAALSGGQLDGTLYENHGNGSTWNEARFIAWEPHHDVNVSVQRFNCPTGSNNTPINVPVAGFIDEPGRDQMAFLSIDDWHTSGGNHMSFDGSCSVNANNTGWDCSVRCNGSGINVGGSIVLVDGHVRP